MYIAYILLCFLAKLCLAQVHYIARNVCQSSLWSDIRQQVKLKIHRYILRVIRSNFNIGLHYFVVRGTFCQILLTIALLAKKVFWPPNMLHHSVVVRAQLVVRKKNADQTHLRSDERKTLFVHPAANGYPILSRAGEGLGGEEKWDVSAHWNKWNTKFTALWPTGYGVYIFLFSMFPF